MGGQGGSPNLETSQPNGAGKSRWLGPRLLDQLASAVPPLTSPAVSGADVSAGWARGQGEDEAAALEAQRSEFSRCAELSQGWGVGHGWAVSSKVLSPVA
jgi:hypothetical protein